MNRSTRKRLVLCLLAALTTGVVASLADIAHLFVVGRDAKISLVAYLILSVVGATTFVGTLLGLWSEMALRGSGETRSWRFSIALSLPLVAFFFWVPTSWVNDHWNALGGAARVAVGVCYLALAAAALVGARLVGWVFHEERHRRERRLLAGLGGLLAAGAFVIDARILVGLYADFHMGLAIVSLLSGGLAAGLILAEVRLSDELHVWPLWSVGSVCAVGAVIWGLLSPVSSVPAEAPFLSK